MLSLEKFIDMYKNSGVSRESLEQLYYSMIRSCILITLGRKQSQAARQTEDVFQQSIIMTMDFSKVPIAGKFLEKIFDREADLREDAKQKKYSPHTIKQFVIESRIAIYVPLLQLRVEDIDLLKKAEMELEKMRKPEKNHKDWKIGVTVAAGAFALKLLFDLLSKKGRGEKKEDEEESKKETK